MTRSDDNLSNRIKRSTIVLVLIACAFYFGFIAMGVMNA